MAKCESANVPKEVGSFGPARFWRKEGVGGEAAPKGVSLLAAGWLGREETERHRQARRRRHSHAHTSLSSSPTVGPNSMASLGELGASGGHGEGPTLGGPAGPRSCVEATQRRGCRSTCLTTKECSGILSAVLVAMSNFFPETNCTKKASADSRVLATRNASDRD
jgi:hypothetical protein